MENMKILSERTPTSTGDGITTSLNFNDKVLNFTPALTKQHHSNLANIYVFQAQSKVDFIDPTKMKAGETGGLIAGIHAGVVQLKDGSLMALGRNNNIEDASGVLRMPMSISKDMGKSWSYSPSDFPPIGGGQRLVFLRLQEGPLLLVSFTHHPEEPDENKKGMLFSDGKGGTFKGYGMYAALSYDDGKTWPVKKLLTDGKERYLNGGAWTGAFEMDQTHAEPRGYLAITQSPDNLIHLVSSSIHYRFNLSWLSAK